MLNKSFSAHPRENRLKTAEIIQEINNQLPEIAQKLLSNQPEWKEPDNPIEHEPRWHQWGIITHSRKFTEQFEYNIPQYLEKWDLNKKTNNYLDQKIDSITKNDLLKISSLLHDIGKFTTRIHKEKDGVKYNDFAKHDQESGRLIRQKLNSQLSDLGLTTKQIEYVARSAELHYQFGHLREIAKQSSQGYNLSFVESQELKDQCELIIKNNPEYSLEIGLMFLADSMSKTENFHHIFDISSEEELQKLQPKIDKTIYDKKLPITFKDAINQVPVNIGVARKYLGLWVRNFDL